MPSKSAIKRRPGYSGEFGRETPPLNGTAANVNMWFAAWHLDHGYTVAETERFVDILRELKWTAENIRDMSTDKLIQDIRSCGYEYEWAPRLAGDMERAMTLKYSISSTTPKIPFQDLPNLVISPNIYFIDNTPPPTALRAEVRAWLGLWFSHRPEDPGFKNISMRFAYQCPLAFLEEVMWDGLDIVFFNAPRLKKAILAKYLRSAYVKALASDIREGRKLMRLQLSSSELRHMQERLTRRAGASS